MNTRTITKLGLAAAIAGLVPLGMAGPAQAATTVTHQGCTVSVDAPIFTNHFNASGVKLFDYTYHLSCVASPGGVSVELRQDRHESDLVGRPGDPDAPDEYTGGFTRNHVFAAAGGSANITVRATLPAVNDDTDVPLEMYQVAKLRVTSGFVTGSWSPQAIGNARALTP